MKGFILGVLFTLGAEIVVLVWWVLSFNLSFKLFG